MNGLLSPVAGRLCVNESTVIFDGSTLIQLPCATMPQRHLIMGGTFRKALYYGLVDIDSEKLIYLLKGFSLDKLFEVNPIIGARGHNLSGGELASLLLCRAFLSSYSIIILDEPCNNLDNASISFLKMVVAQEMKERIVIIADHGHGFRTICRLCNAVSGARKNYLAPERCYELLFAIYSRCSSIRALRRAMAVGIPIAAANSALSKTCMLKHDCLSH